MILSLLILPEKKRSESMQGLLRVMTRRLTVMKLVFIVSGEPLTITSHVSVVKTFLATDELPGET